jgi:hypothetical protein
VYDELHEYCLKVLLECFNTKVRREDIFKMAVRNGSLHEIQNGNEVRVVNFSMSKLLIVRNRVFPQNS